MSAYFHPIEVTLLIILFMCILCLAYILSERTAENRNLRKKVATLTDLLREKDTVLAQAKQDCLTEERHHKAMKKYYEDVLRDFDKRGLIEFVSPDANTDSTFVKAVDEFRARHYARNVLESETTLYTYPFNLLEYPFSEDSKRE